VEQKTNTRKHNYECRITGMCSALSITWL